ncbi:MAG: hypothetical protein HJJLKODD_02007 [Phycisphaerae bacterium]|nr:hypothetical protein [Phycisphaerae bacterium]
MPLIVHGLMLDLDEPQDRLLERLTHRLQVPGSAIRTYGLVRRSLDARRNRPLQMVYSVEVALDQPLPADQRLVQRLHRPDVQLLPTPVNNDPQPGQTPLPHRPVVVGFGPAGMYAAYRLAQWGYRPLVLERGQPVRTRHRDIMLRYYRQRDFDPESNLLFGEGGAGAYSDGKLYTRINQPLVQWILQVFYEHGADADILIDGRPHIGSDRLPNICMRIRRRIEEWGGEIRFGTRLEELLLDEQGAVRGVHTSQGPVAASQIILAVGHSARDTLRRLVQGGVRAEAKPFQMGVRIEHPQALVDHWQYGDHCLQQRLPAAEYHLVAKRVAGAAGDLFSFCMCPGGTILPSNESPGLIVTNGASRASRGTPFANSGLVITVSPDQFANDPLAGLAFQEQWEKLAYQTTSDYRVPVQRASDFLGERISDGAIEISYPLGGQWCALAPLLPPLVHQSIGRGLESLQRYMPGFAGPEGLITAPETRASAPIRLPRDTQTRESLSTPGLFPVGEGAGYAGGIISAAVDGLRSADTLINRFAPFK